MNTPIANARNHMQLVKGGRHVNKKQMAYIYNRKNGTSVLHLMVIIIT